MITRIKMDPQFSGFVAAQYGNVSAQAENLDLGLARLREKIVEGDIDQVRQSVRAARLMARKLMNHLDRLDLELHTQKSLPPLQVVK